MTDFDWHCHRLLIPSMYVTDHPAPQTPRQVKCDKHVVWTAAAAWPGLCCLCVARIATMFTRACFARANFAENVCTYLHEWSDKREQTPHNHQPAFFILQPASLSSLCGSIASQSQRHRSLYYLHRRVGRTYILALSRILVSTRWQ